MSYAQSLVFSNAKILFLVTLLFGALIEVMIKPYLPLFYDMLGISIHTTIILGRHVARGGSIEPPSQIKGPLFY